jgi:hypothetical protein
LALTCRRQVSAIQSIPIGTKPEGLYSVGAHLPQTGERYTIHTYRNKARRAVFPLQSLARPKGRLSTPIQAAWVTGPLLSHTTIFQNNRVNYSMKYGILHIFL